MFPNASAWRAAHQLHATVHMAVPGNNFLETDLVSDVAIPGHPVHTIDPNLVNPWGIAYSPTGPFWINDNNATPSAVTVYDGEGNKFPINGSSNAITFESPAANPTGEVFNPSAGFMVDGQPAKFLFATENGTIAAWSPGTSDGMADVVIDNSTTSNGFGTGEVYKGLAIGQSHGDTFLFASDFRDGRVEVYNSQFQPVKSFTDPTIPQHYAPFNVQVLDHHLFVTFAVRNASGHDDLAAPGRGFVDEFNFNGTMVARVASHGVLDSPWGLAIAPRASGNSPVTSSSAISAMARSMPSTCTRISLRGRCATAPAIRSRSTASGACPPATPQAATRIRSTSQQDSTARPTACLAG